MYYYNKTLSLNPKNKTARKNRAGINEKLGNYKKSLDDYLIVTKLDSLDPDIYYNISSYYDELRNMDSALFYISKCITLDPNYAQGYNVRGIYYYYLGDYKKSLADFTRSLELDSTPSAYRTIYNRAQMYYYLRMFPESIKDFEWGNRVHYGVNYDNMYGWMYFEYEKYDSAIVKFQCCVDSNFSAWDSELGISLCYYMKKDIPNAKKHLSIASELEPRIKQGMKGIVLLEGKDTSYTDYIKKIMKKMFAELL